MSDDSKRLEQAAQSCDYINAPFPCCEPYALHSITYTFGPTGETCTFPPDHRDAEIAKLRSLLGEAAQVIDDMDVQNSWIDEFAARLRKESGE